ncbi:hypothetical protein K438DRAFT_1784143 [Mycena galopus ATCC 62051]|nr:hypothetical protein K438DRAFT_1784143 [Mycena galopus ATCC 62051]
MPSPVTITELPEVPDRRGAPPLVKSLHTLISASNSAAGHNKVISALTADANCDSDDPRFDPHLGGESPRASPPLHRETNSGSTPHANCHVWTQTPLHYSRMYCLRAGAHHELVSPVLHRLMGCRSLNHGIHTPPPFPAPYLRLSLGLRGGLRFIVQPRRLDLLDRECFPYALESSSHVYEWHSTHNEAIVQESSMDSSSLAPQTPRIISELDGTPARRLMSPTITCSSAKVDDSASAVPNRVVWTLLFITVKAKRSSRGVASNGRRIRAVIETACSHGITIVPSHASRSTSCGGPECPATLRNTLDDYSFSLDHSIGSQHGSAHLAERIGVSWTLGSRQCSPAFTGVPFFATPFRPDFEKRIDDDRSNPYNALGCLIRAHTRSGPLKTDLDSPAADQFIPPSFWRTRTFSSMIPARKIDQRVSEKRLKWEIEIERCNGLPPGSPEWTHLFNEMDVYYLFYLSMRNDAICSAVAEYVSLHGPHTRVKGHFVQVNDQFNRFPGEIQEQILEWLPLVDRVVTGIALSGSAVAWLATYIRNARNSWVPNDLDFYVPQRCWYFVLRFFTMGTRYRHVRVSGAGYAGIPSIRRIAWINTQVDSPFTLNLMQCLDDKVYIPPTQFHSTCVVGCVTADSAWFGNLNLTSIGISIMNRTSFRMLTTAEKRRALSVIRKWQARGFSFLITLEERHVCGRDLRCPATLRTSDDAACTLWGVPFLIRSGAPLHGTRAVKIVIGLCRRGGVLEEEWHITASMLLDMPQDAVI